MSSWFRPCDPTRNKHGIQIVCMQAIYNLYAMVCDVMHTIYVIYNYTKDVRLTNSGSLPDQPGIKLADYKHKHKQPLPCLLCAETFIKICGGTSLQLLGGGGQYLFSHDFTY